MAWLVERGAEACAWRNMSDADWQQSWEKAIAWQPTHLCEMGADITTLLHQRGEFGNIVAGLEATGSGVNRLGDIQPGYPIFNWDDLPVKEGCTTAIWSVSPPGTPSSRPLISPCMRKKCW